MAVEALCPTCGAVFSLKDEYLGKKVRCKKCEQVFTVGGEGKAAARDDDDQGVQAKAGAVPPKKSSRDDEDERPSRRAKPGRGGRDDEDDERPRKSASRRGRDDDDDEDDDDRGRRRKRVYHDDDDEDDDDRPRRRAKPSGGGAGKVLAIVGSIVLVVVLVCGGAIYGIVRMVDSAAEQANDQLQQAMQDAAANGGQPPGFPGFPGAGRQPNDVADALASLKGADVNDRRAAANWLAKQPVDAARQKEVASALEPLARDADDNTCAAGARALKVWGTKDNGPALAAALKQRPEAGIPGDAVKELMSALAQVKYEPGAEEITRFLPNHFVGADAERALDQFGPGAEKAVVKYFNYPDRLPGGARDRARGLVIRYKTKPVVLLDQAVEDLGAPDQERAKAAAEWLSRPASDEALQLAKADPARRGKVATGLNRLLDPPPTFFEDTILAAVKRWGTKDNVASLVHLLTTTPFKKREAADALIAIGPACEPQVKPLLTHTDRGVANEAKRVIDAVGSAESKLDAILADLRSDDGRSRVGPAARSLQKMPVDEKLRPQVVSALLDALNNTGPGHTDGDCAHDVARALTVWAKKDDGAAVADKVRVMNGFFARQARATLIEWMGKEKAEKAIPFLAAALTDRDLWQSAGKALQAMGPDLGEQIETEVSKVSPTDRNQLAECFKVLGAVGTKKSLDLLKKQQAIFVQKRDVQMAAVCKDAMDAITARGK